MKLATIPPGAAFLPELVLLWRDRAAAAGAALADGLILLPTRRAARGLAAAFLDAAGGAPLLLPRIVALGALDEAPLALAGALTLPPAITPAHRRAVLAKLILAMGGADGAPTRADGAWTLAGDLASLMDEAERAEIDLHQGLADAADGAHAEHWETTLRFLRIVTTVWPDYLAEQGLMNPAARQVALMDAQVAAWTAAPPAIPVLAVSAAGDIPAVARLLRAVACLPGGLVVLPGLDQALDETVWDSLDEAHPQFGLRTLLQQMGATRGDVPMPRPGARVGRAALLRRALLPASALGSWQEPFTPALSGLTLLTPSDGQEEAVAIAMILRDALEVRDATAALVTPDRGLAVRVAAELGRWGVVADDSAGEQLALTPPAVFLRLIAAAVAVRLAPVALLAVLKHPLAAAGLEPSDLRRRARLLDRICLRGPTPEPGIGGLRRTLDRRGKNALTAADRADLHDLFDRLERCLEPVLRITAAVICPPADLFSRLIAAAEALAATDDADGPARLWAMEEGEALAVLLAEVQEMLPVLPDGSPACLPGLLDAVMDGAVVRSRRAIRGRGGAEHPRLFIWGLLEARLQHAEVVVLGGLTEGVWPPATDPGPWLSRPMRVRAGLASPELLVGQAAHDFCMTACAAPRVVLSAPRRRDGAPAVPSRWITRLEAMLGVGLNGVMAGGLPVEDAGIWPAALDVPVGGAAPVAAPRPCPPVAVRPRRLRLTDVEILRRDPYAIYARLILGLDALDPLEQAAEFKDYGTIVHAGLHKFLRDVGADWPDDAAARLDGCLHSALREEGVRIALIAWWSPRLRRIAEWVDIEERRRRVLVPVVRVIPEQSGQWTLAGPAGPFTLSARADRIERRADGSLAILDYKTGSVPSQRDVAAGVAPQLVLEAAMAEAGAFGPDVTGPVTELTYWRLTGGHEPGEHRSAGPPGENAVANMIGSALGQLDELIARYDDPLTVYPANPTDRRGFSGDYAQLARTAEWGVVAEEPPDPADPADVDTASP